MEINPAILAEEFGDGLRKLKQAELLPVIQRGIGRDSPIDDWNRKG